MFNLFSFIVGISSLLLFFIALYIIITLPNIPIEAIAISDGRLFAIACKSINKYSGSNIEKSHEPTYKTDTKIN